MELNIYGWSILEKYFPKVSFSKTFLKKSLKKEISDLEIDSLNVIFVPEDEIKRLNSEYRGKDTSTDVLSFRIEENPLKGEIYLSPEYISKENDEKEILRVIVHGILHLVGFEHEGYFDEKSFKKEEMFVKQEEILENVYTKFNKN